MKQLSGEGAAEELDALITSYVLGELSQAEATRMEERLAQDASLRDTIEQRRRAAGLIGEVMVESHGKAALALSAERREKLFQHFKVAHLRTVPSSGAGERFRWRDWFLPLTAAAALVVICGLVFGPASGRSKPQSSTSAKADRASAWTSMAFNNSESAVLSERQAVITPLYSLNRDTGEQTTGSLTVDESSLVPVERDKLRDELGRSDSANGLPLVRGEVALGIAGPAQVASTPAPEAPKPYSFGGFGGSAGGTGMRTPASTVFGAAGTAASVHDSSLFAATDKKEIARGALDVRAELRDSAVEPSRDAAASSGNLPASTDYWSYIPSPPNGAKLEAMAKPQSPAVPSNSRLAPGATVNSLAEAEVKLGFQTQSSLGPSQREPQESANVSQSLAFAQPPAIAVNLSKFYKDASINSLEPLQLRLPAPAFKGTPKDFGFRPPVDQRLERLREGAVAQPQANGREEQARFLRRTGGAVTNSAAVGGRVMRASQLLEEKRKKSATAAQGGFNAQPAEFAPEIAARENPLSTFSLNVSDVSYRLTAEALESGNLPSPGSIRVEEFINAFDYRDPEPHQDSAIAFQWDQARYTFAHNRILLRLSIKTAAEGRAPGKPLNLVLLLDNSGSMERPDRVSVMRRAFSTLADQLGPQDRVSVLTFSRTPSQWSMAELKEEARQTMERALESAPEGGTNLEEALRAAYRVALQTKTAAANTRVITFTDGAANLGEVDASRLKAMVDEHRAKGIALDAFGIGWDGYNDYLLETLSRNGDGRYGYLNSGEDVAAGFAKRLTGALRVAAADVKVQVEFNPARVNVYRQAGYTRHQLTKQQFRDNTVDAAELGAAEAGNAVYIVEPIPSGSGPLATVRARYKNPSNGAYNEREWRVPFVTPLPSLENASPSTRLAAASFAFAERLAQSPYAAEANADAILQLLAGVPEAMTDPASAKLQSLVQTYKSIAGE